MAPRQSYLSLNSGIRAAAAERVPLYTLNLMSHTCYCCWPRKKGSCALLPAATGWQRQDSTSISKQWNHSTVRLISKIQREHTNILHSRDLQPNADRVYAVLCQSLGHPWFFPLNLVLDVNFFVFQLGVTKAPLWHQTLILKLVSQKNACTWCKTVDTET